MVDKKELRKTDIETAIKQLHRDIEQDEKILAQYKEQIKLLEGKLEAISALYDMRINAPASDLINPNYKWETSDEYVALQKKVWAYDKYEHEIKINQTIGSLYGHIASVEDRIQSYKQQLILKESELEDLQ